jgi:TfoX/Sxy family transcriptional regulator of competence genes
MAFDEALRARLRARLGGMDGIAEKPMFGGIGFMLRGNLLCGVMGEDLLVRIAGKDFDRYVGDDGARPMAMGGRSSKGWILVPSANLGGEPEMSKWIDRAIEFVATLPAK